MLQFPPCCEAQILVASACVRHIGLTDRHLSLGFPPPTEVMHNCPAARLRHEGFEPNYFVLDPLFWLGEDLAWRYRLLTTHRLGVPV